MMETELSRIIIDVAMNIHRQLGPGLLENVNENILAYELEKHGLAVERQVPIPVVWEAA
jgi:GxxExxY protein